MNETEKMMADFIRQFDTQVERRYGVMLTAADLNEAEADAMADWLVDCVWPDLKKWPTVEGVAAWLNRYRSEHSLST